MYLLPRPEVQGIDRQMDAALAVLAAPLPARLRRHPTTW